MPADVTDRCPRCSGPLEKGFAHRTVGLAFVSPEKLRQFIFVGEDLNKRSLLTKMLPSRARYSPGYVCRACRLFLVEYGTVLTHKEAKELAALLETRGRHPA